MANLHDLVPVVVTVQTFPVAQVDVLHPRTMPEQRTMPEESVWATVSEGQYWRSTSDGSTITIVARAHASAWLTRLPDNDEVLVTVDEEDLLQSYELVPQGLDFM